MIFPNIPGLLPGSHTCIGPAGDIRGGLHQYLSHSDVGPKITYKSRNFEKTLQQNFQTEFSFGHEFCNCKKISEYNQEIPYLHTADQPMTPLGRSTEQSQ